MPTRKRPKHRRQPRRRTVHIARPLALSAARIGRRNGRSQEEQFELWIRLGQAAEESLSGASVVQLLKHRRIAKAKSRKSANRAKK